MKTVNQCLISKESGRIQIPYGDYAALMERVKEGERRREVKTRVIDQLQRFLGTALPSDSASAKNDDAHAESSKQPQAASKPAAPKKEAEPAEAAKAAETAKTAEPAEDAKPAAPAKAAKPAAKNSASRSVPKGVEVPPIKKDISAHFNHVDDSGRLFNVFKQYYACLNDACGGTVRVTMKDGICSLWNYDEWEEFAFIDLFDGMLRIAVDPRYTDALESLNLCEVPRLLSSRHNLICVQVDGLNKTMLHVLVKAFEEVGQTAS